MHDTSIQAMTSSDFPWRCPRCRGELRSEKSALCCRVCEALYETVAGIPDLRVPGDSWIDFEDDLEIARELAASEYPTLVDLVRSVYARRQGWDEARVELRTSQVLQGSGRLRADLRGWLNTAVRPNRRFLDLGCGAGMLIGAAAGNGCKGLGIDVSMTWLVVAKRLIAEAGGEPVLAAALGEALPLPDQAVDAVVSLDVIEHVRDPARYLSEINRVTKPDGGIALSTPNRFSLTSEPHVFVWGVGWLPQPWQASFVRWRSGKSYADTKLLSSFGLRRLLRSNTDFASTVIVPPIAPEEIERFPVFKARLARIYNRVRTQLWLRWLFLLVGPFFQVVGAKNAPP